MTERFLDLKDVDKIVNLEKESFSDGWEKEVLISSFNSGRFFAIGKFNGDYLLGFVSFSLTVSSSDIESVCTDKNYRRQGICESLMKSSLSFIKEKGVDKVYLEVRKSNKAAISLYEKMGFKSISERKKYYFDGEDAVIYLKEI